MQVSQRNSEPLLDCEGIKAEFERAWLVSMIGAFGSVASLFFEKKSPCFDSPSLHKISHKTNANSQAFTHFPPALHPHTDERSQTLHYTVSLAVPREPKGLAVVYEEVLLGELARSLDLLSVLGAESLLRTLVLE
jgi:hypothetical protein